MKCSPLHQRNPNYGTDRESKLEGNFPKGLNFQKCKLETTKHLSTNYSLNLQYLYNIRAHRTSKLYSQIDCAASVGQCKTLSNLKSRSYICKEHPHWAEKMVDFEIWISRPWLWLVYSNFWIMIFEGLQELSKFLFDFLLLHKFLNTYLNTF